MLKGRLLTTRSAVKELQDAADDPNQVKFKEELDQIDRVNPRLYRLAAGGIDLFKVLMGEQPFRMVQYMRGVTGAHYAIRRSAEFGSNELIPVTDEAQIEFVEELHRHHTREGGKKELLKWMQDKVEQTIPEVYRILAGEKNAPDLMCGVAVVAIPTKLTLDELNLDRLSRNQNKLRHAS